MPKFAEFTATDGVKRDLNECRGCILEASERERQWAYSQKTNCGFLLNKDFVFQRSFRFAEILRKSYRDFPHTYCLYACTGLSTVNTPHQGGTRYN